MGTDILGLPDDYFRAEIRDGFYVDGLMKRAWAAQMQELVIFNEICRKYSLQWFADCGTLLGAVRHKGFIPWDDDIDICMLRDDYERFKAVMYDEYPDSYVIRTIDARDPKYRIWDNLTVIRNSAGYDTTDDYLDSHYQFPYAAGIDIFPLDFIPDDPDELTGFKNLCTLIYTAMNPAGGFDNLPENEQQGLITTIEQSTGYTFRSDEDFRAQLFRLGNAVFSMYHRDECSRVVMMGWWLSSGGHEYQKKWYGHQDGLLFEKMMIPVSGDVDGQLRQEYGDGYMEYNHGFLVHDYPFFRQPEQALIKDLGYDPFYYHCDVSDIPESRKADSPRKVLFIVPHASDWNILEKYYEKRISDGAEAVVMPVPVYDCDFDKRPIRMNYEYDDFPEDLRLIDYSSTDIAALQCDEIVISFPYDQYNYTEAIDERFYSSVLREQTAVLTYVVPFETDDSQAMSPRDQIAMTHYVNVPGVILSDRVVVQSEAMKEAYITCLDSFFGEDVNDIFTKRIVTR